ncbi:hypothetical protein J1N35_004492 [Gossypium stocksii]|uniref:Uncharacterized protein n=1 Tax=Gossypium stocksii TaxID=47602 RepID=A0A9D3WC33_9ROSI|nr:hypothetical protein J1N35_004492 [Gossypium stocksii]
MQYRYLELVDSFKYELFDVKVEQELKAVISLHYLSENVVIELYVKFAEADGAGPSLATIAANVETKLKQNVLLHDCVVGSPVCYKTPTMMPPKHQWANILQFSAMMQTSTAIINRGISVTQNLTPRHDI